MTAWVALKSVDGVGSVVFRNLLAVYGSPARVFEAPLDELERAAGLNHKTARNIKEFRAWDRVRSEIARAEREGVSIVTCEDPGYPERLRRIYDPPPLLYIKGSLETADIPVAVVGSRNASPYGRYVTEILCRELAQRGVTVVSGLARGIDTCAHRGALSARGRTIAVMGCGIDVIYPPENRKLHGEIAVRGAVVTEYPFGTEPDRPHFPARNRIISGLSLGVLIVEAGEKSGSLITAQCALEQNREVFAVPGGIDLPGSRGTNRLLRQGAKLVESAEDILDEILPQLEHPPAPMQRETKTPAGRRGGTENHETGQEPLTENESRLLGFISETPQDADTLINRAGLAAAEALALLLSLELKGYILQLPGKRFKRKET
ncbi:MAG: DNA-protecting protein DprA [Syntrophaceae bacterium]|nr:DNA-protecting protein DprA [Syntrophaceae bacterium]